MPECLSKAFHYSIVDSDHHTNVNVCPTAQKFSFKERESSNKLQIADVNGNINNMKIARNMHTEKRRKYPPKTSLYCITDHRGTNKAKGMKKKNSYILLIML